MHPFNWLDHSALPDVANIRDKLEEWFAAYPNKEKRNLKNNFQNQAYSHHLGAWWELYVFTLYRELGFDIELHPAVPGTDRRPDFLVTKDDATYYVECTVVSPVEHNGERDEPRERWIHAALKAVSTKDFHLGVSLETVGKQEPSVPIIVGELEDWLSTLDPEAGVGGLRSLTLTPKDWEITIQAHPVATEANQAEAQGGRFLGVLPPDRTVAINDVQVVHDTVEDKGRCPWP